MSVSSVSLSSDANVRYQRLAQEYTKLRAQAKVLREGVLEERSKVEKLTEELKSKEATIRRLQSENEALTFRNDQLSIRVENFQFQKPQTLSKKTTIPKEAPPLPAVDILEQELRQKLAENESLVSKLAESERQHAIEMAEMSEKLAREMRKLEEEVRKMRMRGAAHREEVKEENQKKLKEKEAELEEIGSPEPPESQEEAKLMVVEAARGTFFAFHNVFNLFQQRSEIYPYDVTMERLPAHVEKLSSEYAQTARLFSDLTDILDAFLSSETPTLQLSDISSKCRLISEHCHQMLSSLIVQMTSEESKVTWCTPPLAKLNDEWQLLILRVFEIFENITRDIEEKNHEESKVVVHLEALEEVTMRMVDCFQKRWIFESRLPTTTRRMRCVGQALEKAIQMVAQETSKLHARAKRVQTMPIPIPKSEDPNEQVEKIVAELPVEESRSSKNPFDSETESEESAEAPRENGQNISTRIENLPEVLDQSKNLTETEVSTPRDLNPEESENPKIPHQLNKQEAQVLRQKYENLQKERDKLFVEFSLCKRKLEISLNDGAKMEKSDLETIWDIGMERRDDWIRRVELAEQAVRFYKNELHQVLHHELDAEEHLKHVRQELSEVSALNNRLEDELESVRRSYESQLGDLSDHLATLVKEKEKDKEASKSRGSLKTFFNKSSS